MPSLKVLICGGGIAGTALAFWLSKSGHNVTLVERTPELRSSGLQIDLRGHGIEVLRRMGLEDGFRELSAKEEGLEFVNRSGKVQAYFPANTTGKGKQSFTSEFEIMRGDLVKLFYEPTKDRIRTRFGIWVESLLQDENSVNASFSDGTSEKFDLLVGADGQGSRTRKMMNDFNAKNSVNYLGGWTAYFTLPWPAKKGEEYRASAFLAPGNRFIMIRRSKPHQVQVYLTCNRDSEHFENLRRGDIAAEKGAFAKIFADAGWRAKEVLAGMDGAADFYCERPGLVKLDEWSKGRVVLLGDAAYCPTANTGMGTTSSVVGAYILAGEIDKSHQESKDIRSSLESYEKLFQPFMTQLQKGVVENDQGWLRNITSSRWAIAVFIFLLGIAAWLKVDVLSYFVMREDIKDWTLPDYPRMNERVGNKARG